ncbi:MAG TPA: methanogenesis marker 2 protein [Methanomicrobia archaeon]|nr:methanogenesis marker 2 protein [Methanomicrobia archaeon]
MLETIIKSIREYEGVTRKNPIKTLTTCFSEVDDFGHTEISFGDDSAVLKTDDGYLLFAADGIWSKLMDRDPVWAGYCAVLANVNDIYAMGGRPLALTNVMSIKDEKNCPRIIEGICRGCTKFKVPMVGGHLHPNTQTESLSISIIGKATRVLTSFDATPGQDILVAVDTTGEQHDEFLNWDSTSMKSPDEVVARLDCIVEVAEKGYATACKDISNPGLLGTIGMLLETSEVGATIDIDAIPRPEALELDTWLKMYPGFGFILTCDPKRTSDVCGLFTKQGVECAVIGTINDSKRMEVTLGDERGVLFDFSKDIITGITKRMLPR